MLSTRAPARRSQARQRGLSIVELMVGVAVGLFVVAGATAIVGGQLGDTRRLVSETQIQQDLRSAADIIVRDMRRAGFAGSSYLYVWGDTVGDSQANLYMDMSPTSGVASSVQFKYERDTNQYGPFGFRLQNGVIQMLFGIDTRTNTENWQDLTDARVMTVTEFNVTPRPIQSTQMPCPKNCADGTTACWPTITVRDIDVKISAQSKTDASVVRTIVSTARLRNDHVDYNVAGAPTQLCP